LDLFFRAAFFAADFARLNLPVVAARLACLVIGFPFSGTFPSHRHFRSEGLLVPLVGLPDSLGGVGRGG
jgi:hypothetical protein